MQQRLENRGVKAAISSPSSEPMLSLGANRVYPAGVRATRWTLDALDWGTGESLFHFAIGGQRYNVFFAAILLDEDGSIHCGSSWGRVRLAVPDAP